ncbi:MAG: hypothetical protein ABIQ93_15570, partial [Saprospiraceae bacterium]
NSLHNNPRISLLVCSRKAIDAQELYIGGKAVSGSRLEFSERVPLSDLTFAEIEAYLERRMPDSAQKIALFTQKPSFYTPLITEIDAHPECIGFAEFVAEQSIDPTWNFDAFQERLRFWKKEYTRLHTRTFDRKLGHIEQETRRWKHRTDRFLGLSKLWRSIGLKMKIALALLVSLALGGWKWMEQGWAFASSFFINEYQKTPTNHI